MLLEYATGQHTLHRSIAFCPPMRQESLLASINCQARFKARLELVRWHVGRAEDLPEQVLAAARLSHVEFAKAHPFPAETSEQQGGGGDDSDSLDSAAER